MATALKLLSVSLGQSQDTTTLEEANSPTKGPVRLKRSFAKPDFWFKSRLSEFQKSSLLVVNETFEIFK
ncbi:MAG: hypothetical protein AAGC64_13370 [Bacteroidota bacterium]